MTNATIFARIEDELFTTYVDGDGHPEAIGRLLMEVYSNDNVILNVLMKDTWEFIGSPGLNIPFKGKLIYQPIPYTEVNLYYSISRERTFLSDFHYFWDGKEWFYNTYADVDDEISASSKEIYDDSSKSKAEKMVALGKILRKKMLRLSHYEGLKDYPDRDAILMKLKSRE